MRLELYITDLLFRHDCVIVPGIGAFISRSLPAEIESSTNMFRPSRKQLAFNASMKETDGLLVGYVSRTNKWSFEFAAEQVNKAVLNWKHELSQGKKIRLEYIGQLYYSEQSAMQFLPAINSNFSLESFGMGIFHVPVVTERIASSPNATKEVPITEEAVSPEIAAKTRRSWAGWRWAAVLVPLLAIGSLAWTQRQGLVTAIESYSNVGPVIFGNSPQEEVPAEFEGVQGLPKKSVIPFNTASSTVGPESTPSDAEVSNTSTEEVAETETEVPVAIEIKEAKPVESTEIVETKKVEAPKEVIVEKASIPVTKAISRSSNKSYFIVVGSFKEAANGRKMIASLKSKGYNAEVAPGSGLSRISAVSFATRQEAVDALQSIKENVEAGAWIYHP